ncbi:MAG: ATP-dependent DNA ligase, partial [Bacillota bacterium]
MWDPVNGPIAPMLATPVEKAFDSLEYLFEIKWDGYRAIAFLGSETRLQSRRLRDITGEFPDLGNLHRSFPGTSMTLDGEIVVMKGGRPDFQALQHRQGPAIYVAFDILALNGEGLLDHPLVERKRMLAAAVKAAAVGGDERITVAPFFPGAGVSLFEAAAERGLEGIVAKSGGSPYLPGARTAYWKKVRCKRTVDCVIGGVSSGAGSPLGSLALGLYAGHNLIYTGHTGTGFSDREREQL